MKAVHRNQVLEDWIGLSSVLRPRQHSLGYMGDGFYRSKDPTNSIKVLKENLQRKIRQRKQQNTHMHNTINRQKRIQIYITTSPLVYINME